MNNLLTACDRWLFKCLTTTEFTNYSGTFKFFLELFKSLVDGFVFFDWYDDHVLNLIRTAKLEI